MIEILPHLNILVVKVMLENQYGIFLPKEKVVEIISDTELYYDAIMETVYIDYDTYFEEI